MAFPIEFEKSRAEYFLDCLANAKPIEEVWTRNSVLALAGACLFAASSHGPVLHEDRKWDDLPLERQEMIQAVFNSELHGAIQFYCDVTLAVNDGTYDEEYESIMRGIVAQEDDGLRFTPTEGFKGESEQ